MQWIVGGGGARPLPPHTATLLKTGNGSHLLKLLAYLAWDRIGMIVEIASRLRECSRHARSALAFTVYEVEKAIGMLEAQEETSLKKMQERGRAIVSSGAGAEDIDIDSTEATTTIKDATISPRSWAAAANEQLKALAMPGAVAAAASSTESEEVAAAVAAAKAAKEAAVTMEQAGAAYGFPPLHSFPLAPAASSAAPYLPPPEPEAASTPVPKHARFSDGAKLRLQAMADACGWKYRQKNPQVQEIHAMDGLGFDQIRGWMANNKPVEFKRQKPAGPAGPKKKMVLPASPPSPPAMAAPIDDGGPPQLPAGETVGAMKRPTPSPAKKAKGAAAESAAE